MSQFVKSCTGINWFIYGEGSMVKMGSMKVKSWLASNGWPLFEHLRK